MTSHDTDLRQPSTQFVASEPRVLSVPGFRNLRDVGGYPTRRGGRTRSLRLLRSELPVSTDAAVALAAAHTVALVIDLRDDEEEQEIPSPFAAVGLPTRRIPIFAGSAASFVEENFTLERLYRHMLTSSGAAFAQVAAEIAGAEGATLVHCTLGKDRTGLAVALVLDAVGVEREAVVADYAMTRDQFDDVWREARLRGLAEFHGRDLRQIAPLLTESPAAVMRDVLSGVDDTWGGSAGFLLEHGLAPSAFENLVAQLTEESS
jgi:protein-tyrosine phosphatase